MGKRYYCDYCNKSFADNPVSRKTHLSGVVHAQNKRAHYDAFRDEEEILRDEANKRPCRTFLSSGEYTTVQTSCSIDLGRLAT